MIQIFHQPKRRFSRWLSWLWEQEGSPGQRSRGIAAGVFSGCFPLFGLQTLFSIVLARIVRGNQLLAAAGTWVSNPLTYIPIYWFNYQIGCLILGAAETIPNLNQFTIKDFWLYGRTFGIRLIIGSFTVGSFSSIIVALFTYILLKRLTHKKQRIKSMNCNKNL